MNDDKRALLDSKWAEFKTFHDHTFVPTATRLREHRIKLGEMLIELKKLEEPGRFLDRLRQLDIHRRTALNWRKMAAQQRSSLILDDDDRKVLVRESLSHSKSDESSVQPAHLEYLVTRIPEGVVPVDDDDDEAPEWARKAAHSEQDAHGPNTERPVPGDLGPESIGRNSAPVSLPTKRSSGPLTGEQLTFESAYNEAIAATEAALGRLLKLVERDRPEAVIAAWEQFEEFKAKVLEVLTREAREASVAG